MDNCCFATEICPNDRPYAYQNGKDCCNYYFDKDFNILNISSTSCWDDEDDKPDSVPCPFGICQSNLILRSLNVTIMVEYNTWYYNNYYFVILVMSWTSFILLFSLSQWFFLLKRRHLWCRYLRLQIWLHRIQMSKER